MKKVINQLITVVIIATTVNPIHCAAPRKKNDAQASQLTHNIEFKMERAHNAQTPEEEQQLKAELINDIEQATTYFDTVQNFFGYGAIAEKKRAQAEKQKHLLEHKLAQEEIRYKTLTSTQARKKSLEKQNNLKNKIHTEKIALGQAWSWQQKALLGALAAATAYVGYQYGGTAVSTAKEWWSGKTEESIQPSAQTLPTLSERFSAKYTQLKEQGEALQQKATKKINDFLTPTVDQQAKMLAEKAKQNLLWQANERSRLEQTRQDLIAQARQSKEQQAQQRMQRELAEQQRKLAAKQANIERLQRIDNRELLEKSQYLSNNIKAINPNIKDIFYTPTNTIEIDEQPMTWSEWFSSFFKK